MKLRLIKYLRTKIHHRIVVTRRFLKRSKYTRIFGKTIFHHDLWHLSLRSVTLAAAVGTFIAFTPTYGVQVLLSITAALMLRINLPITILMCMLTNPVTIPFVYYYQAKLGLALLGSDSSIRLTAIRNLPDIIRFFIRYTVPLWIGSFITSSLLALISYGCSYMLYNFLSETLPHHKPHVKNVGNIFIDKLEDL